ncbi:transglycosylase SLT domain-containing protein [Nocardia cyriacigeorgica]|uniref:transglycosylase SLT domain-containing protein n=1 Tax=Nocardia cyriacigeorgica TaxID=135487 RepID=UPI0028044682|nr:transglycosylase SLT domain-containing protein [Nocardia cyriacigeorgica]
MTLTIPDVEQWRPEQLTTAATNAATLATRLDGLATTGRTNAETLQWSGPAGTAAKTRMDTEKTRTGAVSAALLELQTALNVEVGNLTETKNKVLQLRDAAQTPNGEMPGFQVAADGTVSAQARMDYLRKHAEGKANVEGECVAEMYLAAVHQWHIANALKAAADTAERARVAVENAAVKLDQAFTTLGDPTLNVVAPTAPASTTPASATAPPSDKPSNSSQLMSNSGSGSGSGGGGGGGSSSGGGSWSESALASGGPPTKMPTGEQAQWIQEAIRVLRENGYDVSDSDAAIIAAIIEKESGGNPNAINLWDSNAAAGIPSKGLMQTIDPTFNSYKLAGHDDIWNPVDNIIAGSRYAIERYGSLSNVPGIVAMSQNQGYVGY